MLEYCVASPFLLWGKEMVERITREQWIQHVLDALHTLDDLGALDLHVHSRMRVYPQAADKVIRLTAAAGVDTFGAWTVCIPIDTVLFPFHLVGVLIENQQAADTFYIQFAINDNPAGDEYLGEARLSLGALAGIFPFIPIPIQSQNIPANTPIYGRVKAKSANGYWLDISLALTRCIPVTNEAAMWPDWPW